MRSTATAIYVAFQTDALDLSWIEDDAPVIIVHNDDLLADDRCQHPLVRHIRGHGNIGFGAAVNLALKHVHTDRVVLCNPDTTLLPVHWQAFVNAGPSEVVVIPLRDSIGRPQALVNRYPTPLTIVLTAFQAGRLAPRGSRVRDLGSLFLGDWGRQHTAGMRHLSGAWPLRTHWPAAAACSYDTHLLVAVGGFDERYFLYFEDVDLAARIARYDPTVHVRLCDTAPGIHSVAASSHGVGGTRDRYRFQLRSALLYAQQRQGMRWMLARGTLATGEWLARSFSERPVPEYR